MQELPVRVYYEDTDAEGVLYHAAVVRYLDRGRTEWMRARGYPLQTLAEAHRRVFVVHDLSVRYLRPGRLDNDLTVRTRLAGQRRVALHFAQGVWRDEECLAEADVRVACVDLDTGRVAALPAEFGVAEE